MPFGSLTFLWLLWNYSCIVSTALLFLDFSKKYPILLFFLLFHRIPLGKVLHYFGFDHEPYVDDSQNICYTLQLFRTFSWLNSIYIWVTWKHCKHSAIKSKFNFPCLLPQSKYAPFIAFPMLWIILQATLVSKPETLKSLLPSFSHPQSPCMPNIWDLCTLEPYFLKWLLYPFFIDIAVQSVISP